jgi:Wzt C-terminal domain
MARTGIIPDDAKRLYSTDEAKLRSVRLTDLNGHDTSHLYLGQPCQVQMTFQVFKEIADAVIEVGIVATDGTHVTNSASTDGGNAPFYLSPGTHTIKLDLEGTLLPRQYSLLVALHHSNGLTVEWIERALDFAVQRVAESGLDSYRWPSVRGYVRPSASWALVREVPSDNMHLGLAENAEDLVVGGSK